MKRLTIFLILMLSVLRNEAQAVFFGIGDLPGGSVESAALGVSADGTTVVGSSSSGPGSEAIRWTTATGIMPLGMPPNTVSSQANAVSADGSVIVGSFKPDSASLPPEAFRWEAGVVTPLGSLSPTFSSFARGVSADGSVVVGNSGGEAFRWVGGTMTGLGDLPGGDFDSVARGVSADGSTVTGSGRSALISPEAFVWTSVDGMVGLGDLPGSDPVSRGKAISADGTTVVGQSHSTLGPGGEAFMWTQTDGMVGLGDLPGGGFDSFALAVSADGTIIVGRGTPAAGGSGAFIWDESNGLRSLKSVLIAQGDNLTGWKLEEATGISADGRTIVGTAINPSGNSEGFWARLETNAVTLVPIDIKPQSCPNPLNVRARGVLPVAIVGTGDFDVTEVDPTSVMLAGVSPLRSAVEDVATPFEPFTGKEDAFDCTDAGPDGFLDLTLKFDTQEVVEAIEADLGAVADNDLVILPLDGELFDGTPIVGEDVVVILKKGRR